MTRTQPAGKKLKLAPVDAPAPVKVFNLSTRRMALSIDVPIMDPLDATVETGMVVRMRSPKSDVMRDAAAAWYAEHAIDGKLDKNQWRAFVLAMAVAATESWEGATTDGTTPLECTPENVRALYAHPESAWIGEQAAAAYNENERFFGARRNS